MQTTATETNEAVTFTAAGAWTGVRRGLPLAPSAFVYGLIFGILARQAGLVLSEALAMSSLVAAGASQFVALDQWLLPLPVATIVLTTLVVNLRHVLLSASLYPWLGSLPRSRRYGAIFFLYDESWALTLHAFNGGYRDGAFLVGCGALLFVAWLIATVLGHTVAAVIPDPARWGLDFAFTAVFIALLGSMWRDVSHRDGLQGGQRRRVFGDLLPWATAAVVAILAQRWLPGTWTILLGGLAGSLVGAVRREP